MYIVILNDFCQCSFLMTKSIKYYELENIYKLYGPIKFIIEYHDTKFDQFMSKQNIMRKKYYGAFLILSLIKKKLDSKNIKYNEISLWNTDLFY